MNKLPDKSRTEWRLLVTGELDVKIKNYVLQMQIDQIRRSIKYSRMTVEQGVDKLYNICNKYHAILQNDIKLIFKI